MENQGRFLQFIVLSIGFILLWNAFVLPRFLPPPPPNAGKQGEEGKAKPVDEKLRDRAVNENGKSNPAATPDAGSVASAVPSDTATAGANLNQPTGTADGAAAQGDPQAASDAARQLPEKHPRKELILGTLDPNSGYRLQAKLTSRGAAVERIELSDPRYRELKPLDAPRKIANNAQPPLPIVSSDGEVATFQTQVPQFGANLRTWDWEVVDVQPAEPPHSSATFRLKSPATGLDVSKRYWIEAFQPKNGPRGEYRSYLLNCDFTIRNLGNRPTVASYELQGPVGIPLENADNTTKFRDVIVGFFHEDGTNDAQMMEAKTLGEGKFEEWKRPFRYIGIDAQYFTTMLIPGGNQMQTPYFRSTTQSRVGPDRKEKGNFTVTMTSNELSLAAAGDPKSSSVSHSFSLFAGPKRGDLINLDFGSYGWIIEKMLGILKFFHSIVGNYGIAIICLTVLVRSCMFPLSIKQAKSAAKMQELQGEMKSLQAKYANDREKLGKATMELYQKHNFNPFGGCALAFVQLPIFISLYQTINYAVELRGAKFLWIDNLAGPDALFQLGFRMPFLGWTEFNLLPVVSVGLFLLQQKMFMPPPMNEEQAMQQKMMNFMMIFIGAMTYRFPAGLCVYFITSSLWGMAERKFLPKAQLVAAPNSNSPSAGGPPAKRAGSDPIAPKEPAREGLLQRLLKAADKELQARREPPPSKRR